MLKKVVMGMLGLIVSVIFLNAYSTNSKDIAINDMVQKNDYISVQNGYEKLCDAPLGVSCYFNDGVSDGVYAYIGQCSRDEGYSWSFVDDACYKMEPDHNSMPNYCYQSNEEAENAGNLKVENAKKREKRTKFSGFITYSESINENQDCWYPVFYNKLKNKYFFEDGTKKHLEISFTDEIGGVK